MVISDDNFDPAPVSPNLAPAADVDRLYPAWARIRILRCLDAIFYSVGLSILFLLLCRFRILFSRSQTDFLILPLLVIGIATLRLPWPVIPARPVERTLFKLKAAGLILAGLMPFTLWWLRLPDVFYLTIGSSLAILTGAWYMMELTAYLGHLLRLWDCPALERNSQLLRLLLFYGVFTPVLTLNILFVWSYFFLPQFTPMELQTFWGAVPFWLRVIMVVPIAGMLLLLWRIRALVPLPRACDLPLAESAPAPLPAPAPAMAASPDPILPAEKEIHS